MQKKFPSSYTWKEISSDTLLMILLSISIEEEEEEESYIDWLSSTCQQY